MVVVMGETRTENLHRLLAMPFGMNTLRMMRDLKSYLSSYPLIHTVTRRLKSIKNIQKITKSMKMVAAAKYSRAERELKPARVYGNSPSPGDWPKVIQDAFVVLLSGPFNTLYEKVDIKPPEDKKKHLLVGVSSDRGLCGAIHTSVAKEIKHQFSNLTGSGKEVMVVGIGDKLRGILQSTGFSALVGSG
ncbi:ATP synthase subunit gamma, mitochondrial, partial [Ophiophagus hannah]